MIPASGEGAWTIASADGLVLIRCSGLSGIPGIGHAFSTRRDRGGDGFDLGAAFDVTGIVAERRSKFLAAAGIDGEAAVLRQVHGDRVVDLDGPITEPPEADGALGAGGVLVPSVRSADCVPILLADRSGRATAAVHAGWRGTAAGIARRAVSALASRGIQPSSIVAAIGPAIGPCCYEVGVDVAAACGADGAEAARPGGTSDRCFLDLKACNRRQLAASGVPDDAIHVAPWCTRCRGDLFFSYRRERDAAGRLMASIGRSRRP